MQCRWLLHLLRSIHRLRMPSIAAQSSAAVRPAAYPCLFLHRFWLVSSLPYIFHHILSFISIFLSVKTQNYPLWDYKFKWTKHSFITDAKSWLVDCFTIVAPCRTANTSSANCTMTKDLHYNINNADGENGVVRNGWYVNWIGISAMLEQIRKKKSIVYLLWMLSNTTSDCNLFNCLLWCVYTCVFHRFPLTSEPCVAHEYADERIWETFFHQCNAYVVLVYRWQTKCQPDTINFAFHSKVLFFFFYGLWMIFHLDTQNIPSWEK